MPSTKIDDGEYDRIMARNEILRNCGIGRDWREYAKGRIAELKSRRWPGNESDRKMRIEAYERLVKHGQL
jgi:hypothetical protein